MITEDYVSFETAKLLKEKGFDEYGMYFYTLKDEGREGYKSNKRLQEFAHNSEPEIKERAVSCPTLQMAMKWLREVHNIALNVCYLVGMWSYSVYRTDVSSSGYNSENFDTYEEACEDGIKFCLENFI